MFEPILQRISYVIVGLALVFAGIAVYWLDYPYKTYVLNVKPVAVFPQDVRSGGAVVLIFDRCNYVSKTAHIEKTLIGPDIQIQLPERDAVISKNCSVRNVPVNIPKITNLGSYHIHYKITWRINPLRTESVEFDTDNFPILK